MVRTVSGDLSPAAIGMVSMHEHLLLDLRVWYTERIPHDDRLRNIAVTSETVADARWNALSMLDNLVLDDAGLAAQELVAFAAAGGDCIVDMTTTGLGRKPAAVAAIAAASGVKVVLGSGYFTHLTHDPSLCEASVEVLQESLRQQIAGGEGQGDALPGTIGEIGMSAPPFPCERRVLRAAARVAAEYEMSLHIHVDAVGAFALEHVSDCLAESLKPHKIVCGHMDERLDAAYHEQVLQTGVTLGFDTFGTDFYFSGAMRHPTDEQRLGALVGLLEAGHEDQIVLAQDVGLKTHLHKFGGFGYDHLPKRILPSLEHEHGISRKVIEKLVITNPRRLLSCNPPSRGH